MNYLTFPNISSGADFGLGSRQALQRSDVVAAHIDGLRQASLMQGPAHFPPLNRSERHIEILSFAQRVEQYRYRLQNANQGSVTGMMRELCTAFDRAKIFSICGMPVHFRTDCKLFHAFKEELAERLATTCAHDVRYLFRNWCEESGGSLLEGLFELALHKLESMILDRRDCKGLIYRMTNQQGVESYVIGTAPCATEYMIKNKLFHAILDKCSELITELGEDIYLVPGIYDAFNSLVTSHKYSLEGQLFLYAFKKGLVQSGLETFQFQKALPRPPLSSKASFDRWMDLVSLERWQRGAEMEFEVALGENDGNENLGDRNRSWLRGSLGKPGFIEKLCQTTTSIAIAVGADHLFGKRGLIKGFEKAGFRVEKV